jgi:hypothetical protein
MDKTQLATDLQTVFSDFRKVLSAIPDDRLNVVPHTGSWTPGQLARHVILSASGFLQVLNGPSRPTDRPYDAGVEKLRATFLDFSTKMKSPEFVVPPAITYDRDRLLASLEKIKDGLGPVIENLDLTQTCTAFELPGAGYLTRWEALHFILYHTQRHLHQLRKMEGEVKELGNHGLKD